MVDSNENRPSANPPRKRSFLKLHYFESDVCSGKMSDSLQSNVPRRKVRTLEDVAGQVEVRLHLSIERLLDREPELFFIGISERALAAWLFHYMLPIFAPWNVDPEYNRHLQETKRSIVEGRQHNGKGSPVTPDVIVHQRRNKFANLLAIEVKPDGMAEKDDRQKLSSYLDVGGLLKYRFAAFLVFGWNERPWCACELFAADENPKETKEPIVLWGVNAIPEPRKIQCFVNAPKGV